MSCNGGPYGIKLPLNQGISTENMAYGPKNMACEPPVYCQTNRVFWGCGWSSICWASVYVGEWYQAFSNSPRQCKHYQYLVLNLEEKTKHILRFSEIFFNLFFMLICRREARCPILLHARNLLQVQDVLRRSAIRGICRSLTWIWGQAR